MATAASLRLWYHYSSTGTTWTLTLSTRWGNLLISALTLLVTTAGACLWSVAALAMHQFRARSQPTNALVLQTQVLLRNPPSALVTLWELIKMSYTWTKQERGQHVCRTLILLAIWPLAISVTFAIASVFVGRIVYSSAEKVNDILVQPSRCGTVGVSTAATLPGAQAFAGKNANDTRAAAAYVDTCYSENSNRLQCTILAQRTLPYNVSITDCPFQGLDRCVNDPLRLDSGYINSNDDLGINAPPGKQIDARFHQECALITTRDVSSTIPDPSVTDKNYTLVEISLGQVDTGVQNITYVYPTRLVNDDIAYTIFSVYNYAGLPSQSPFSPIAAINKSFADVIVHFVAGNSIQYLRPVSDPGFLASGRYNETDPDGTARYLPDHYVNVFACAEQFEYRNPTTNASTGLLGYWQAREAQSLLDLNDDQMASAQRLHLALFSARNYNVVEGQGANALQATKLLSNIFSPGLPADQTRRELTAWFETSLANLQHRISDFPTNDWYVENQDTQTSLAVIRPNTSTSVGRALSAQCETQRTESSGAYVNFVFWGVLIIVILSSIMILLSLVLEPLINKCCCNRRPAKPATYRADGQLQRQARPAGAQRHKYLAYVADSKYSLLRMATQGRNDKSWMGRNESLPWRNENHADTLLLGRPEESETGTSIDYPRHDQMEAVNGDADSGYHERIPDRQALLHAADG